MGGGKGVRKGQRYLHPILHFSLLPPLVPSVHLLELLVVIVVSGLLISRTLAVRRGPCKAQEGKPFAKLEAAERF